MALAGRRRRRQELLGDVDDVRGVTPVLLEKVLELFKLLGACGDGAAKLGKPREGGCRGERWKWNLQQHGAKE